MVFIIGIVITTFWIHWRLWCTTFATKIETTTTTETSEATAS
jgi:hypothetical protein